MQQSQFEPARHSAQHIIVMGVAGCGKSTLAQALASELAWPMLEGDAFHPPENIAKMAAGSALSDADRAPWLAQLNTKLRERSRLVLSCSALKMAYRSALSQGLAVKPLFVHAHGDYEQLLARMQRRDGHFMPAHLLRSQFDALELPSEAGLNCVTVPCQDTTTEQVRQTLAFLNRQSHLML
jgi:carbohydrate kinase (thermoresistant glucokinase family)